MLWDILIALGVGLSQLIITIYAVIVSINEQKFRRALIIGAIGLVGIVLTVVGTWRNGIVQGQLQGELDKIGRNTQPHAKLAIGPKVSNHDRMPIPFSNSVPLGVNLQMMNIGNQAAKHYKIFSRSYVEYGNPEITPIVDHVWSEFTAYVHDTDKRHAFGEEYEFGGVTWLTPEGLPRLLSTTELGDITQGRAHIFITVYVPFEDDKGSHTQEGCMWIQTPADPDSPWHQCGKHEGQIELMQE